MSPEAMELEYTRHAVQVMEEREISVDWIEQVVADPALRIPDPNDPELERFFRRVREHDDRSLRVVVNTQAVPWRVVSAFFDRSMKGIL